MLRVLSTTGVDGAPGFPLTVSTICAVATRDRSPVLSCTVYWTVMFPTNDAAGVTRTDPPCWDTLPLPSATTSMMRSGSSGNGFTSFARTSTVTSSPCTASGTSSSFATGSGRLEASTVNATALETVSSPSVTEMPTEPVVPTSVPSAAATLSTDPSRDTSKPAGCSPVRENSRVSSGSGSEARPAMSSVAAGSATATSSDPDSRVGGTLRSAAGITLVRMVRVDLNPSGSSGPVPSVTSKVMEPFPA